MVGGGDSACEEATYLTRFASKVYLVHRRDQLRASKIMSERTLNHEKIEPVWDSEVIDVMDIEQDKVCLLYTSPSPRDGLLSRMPSSA